MMMALAGAGNLPCVLVPGGVTLPPTVGEDAGKVQTLGVRYATGAISLARSGGTRLPGVRVGGRRVPVPWDRRHRASRRRGARIVVAAFGAGSFRTSRLAGHGPALGRCAGRSLRSRDATVRDILTPAAIRNAMVVHAAFGGSTNLLLHIPAIAHAAGLPRPTVDDWIEINRKVPRLVDALPNGPVGHPTVQVFLAGGVPEVMLHLRELRLLDETCLTVGGPNAWHSRSTGGNPASAAGASATCSCRAMASIPTT